MFEYGTILSFMGNPYYLVRCIGKFTYWLHKQFKLWKGDKGDG